MLENRVARVRAEMKKNGIEQLLITQPQGIYYLTGEWVNPHDRLDALVMTPTDCRMLCYMLAEIHPADCAVTVYRDTGETIPCLSRLLDSAPTGVDGFLHSRFLLPLMAARPEIPMRVSTCVEQARMIKEPDEILRLRRASEVTDRVFDLAFAQVREGMTELELGRVFSECFAQEGVGPFEGNPMVCFGPGSSEPHHQPGSYRLKPGDPIMVDTGKRIDGYYSDMTRTVFFRDVTPRQAKIYQVVLAANEAALAAVRPGVLLSDIHRAACQVIEDAGFGAYYPHRTSHGIGIDYHEEPFDQQGRAMPVAPGMCFSIEPGIYLPGDFGVRIEDLVVVEKDGYSLLNHAPKALRVLP